MEKESAYAKLLEFSRDVDGLRSIGTLLSWDQKTYMPPGGVANRSDQLALIAQLIHQRMTSNELSGLLSAFSGGDREAELNAYEAANVRELKRSHERESKVPPELVDKIERTTSLAQENWEKAKEDSDFSVFEPWLDKTVALKRQWAEAVGYKDEPYDALLDVYEPGLTTVEVAALFDSLRTDLVALVAKIIAASPPSESSILRRDFDAEKLADFSRYLASELGFDFRTGRMDHSAHPFCSGISFSDVRVTTAINKNNPLDSLLAIIHEVGHGLYYQGHHLEHHGTPMGKAASTGVHESQARWWENFVGRSRPFWEHYFPQLRELFPENLDDVDLNRFILAINQVKPSLIRVEADEVTYNLHVIVRFEIERGLINGDVSAGEVPELWNAAIKRYIGVSPRKDSEGALQDPHWSYGFFGYFPTYALGNVYAAQINEAMRRDIDDIDGRLSRGDFADMLEWLREKIHRLGVLYPPRELIARATGSDLDSAALVRYLQNKYLESGGDHEGPVNDPQLPSSAAS